jgi:hypothetical protein
MSRNLVYISIFYNTDYILLFELLLGSIHRFGGLDTHTDLLVLTHPSLEREIQNYLAVKNMYAFFYFLDFTTLFHSAIARLFLFEWEHISNYITILYLDTDILINGAAPTLANFVTMFSWAFAVLLISIFMFMRREREFALRI